MADNDSVDLIMKFEVDKNSYLIGESTTVLDYTESDMATGFQAGNLIELQSFSFRTSLDGSDDEDREKSSQYDKAKKQADKKYAYDLAQWKAAGSKGPRPPHGADGLEKPAGEFSKFFQGKPAKYDTEIAPVEITRAIDRASPPLLQYCINRKTLESATLIKRKAAGGQSATSVVASGQIYLRFDFTKVLIIKVDWDEDDPVKEKIQFISRAVTVSYRPQLPDGSLGAVVPGFWTMTPDIKIFDLKG